MTRDSNARSTHSHVIGRAAASPATYRTRGWLLNRCASTSIAGDGSSPTVSPESSTSASAAANMPVPAPTSSVVDLPSDPKEVIKSTQARNELAGISFPR